MALDPVPPVVDPPAGDDAGRLRRTAQRQWAARRDLERRLHDGAALRVSALTLRLGLLSHLHPGDVHDLRVAVEDLQDELHLVLQDLREIAGRLYPPLLDEAGLGPALREAAGRYAVPVRVDAPDERFGADVEGAAYFAVLGCLPDGTAGRDGTAGPVEVVIRRDADELEVLVSGVDACHAGIAHDGVRLLGGTVAVDRSAAGGALITVRIPCA